MATIDVSPSLLARIEGKDYPFVEMQKELLKAIDSVPSAGWLHIDVMDGKFVPETTEFLDTRLVKYAKYYAARPLDVHLMVQLPERHIASYIEAGANLITFHIETTYNPGQLIERIKGPPYMKVGVALNPDTPLASIDGIIDRVDLICLMAAQPGMCHQSYDERITDKAVQLADVLAKRNLQPMIEIDGGVKPTNSNGIVHALQRYVGTVLLVSGGGIYSAQSPDMMVRLMKGLPPQLPFRHRAIL